MRRISVNRPNAKVRGIKRRLKALDRWAESFQDYVPYHRNQLYWNYKIPVLDRLVNSPTTKIGIQKRAILSLLKAAQNLSSSSLAKQLPYYRVAVLLTLPWMHQSEVAVFYDRDYYSRFYYADNLLLDNLKPSNIYNINLPNSFVERGREINNSDDYDGNIVEWTEKWWTLGQRI